MKRTQIYLTDEQWRDLKVRSRLESVSIAALIRHAVDEMYQRPRGDFRSALERITGLWANRELNTADYLRDLRERDRV